MKHKNTVAVKMTVKIEDEQKETFVKKKKKKNEQVPTLETAACDTKINKNKKKKSSSGVKREVENERKTKTKTKKIKEEQEDPEMDVVFLSEKTGNTDEVTINQERRQALQMEIDKASQPQEPAKLSGFGQWSTAQFSSSEQQQKFLRLMGGFKKGFQPAGESSGRANMALGKDEQQHLQQGLLGDFERAHSRRMNFNSRGAGLGYAAPSNKKFSIDINACRSVRFDD
ncbi:hypothetical protein LDENG_00037820 [Lucifuga dentata]|nr:hypothetical protein LDENG_00037820 [Lucifuga dentata]